MISRELLMSTKYVVTLLTLCFWRSRKYAANYMCVSMVTSRSYIIIDVISSQLLATKMDFTAVSLVLLATAGWLKHCYTVTYCYVYISSIYYLSGNLPTYHLVRSNRLWVKIKMFIYISQNGWILDINHHIWAFSTQQKNSS